MTSSSDSSLYTPLFNLDPVLLIQYFRPTIAFKPLIPPPHISYVLPLSRHHCFLLLAVSLRLLLSLPPDSLRVLQGNAGGLRARSTELLNFLSSHLVDLICIRNSTLTHIPFSGSLDSLFCNLIEPTPGLALSLPMPRTLAAESSYSSVRDYSSLNFLPSLFLCLTPTLIM